MKTRWVKWMMVVTVLGLTGCSYTRFSDAKTDFDPEAPLEEYLTFSWLPDSVTYADNLPESAADESYRVEKKTDKDPFISNRLVEKRIRMAIETELVERGFDLASPASADFFVNYLLVRDKKDGYADRGGRRFYQREHHYRYYPRYGYFYYPHHYRFGYGYGHDLYYRGYPWYWYGEGGYYRYQDGTLIIDIIDAQTRTLVWRGWYSGVINRDNTIDDKTIRRAAKEILKTFPPQM